MPKTKITQRHTPTSLKRSRTYLARLVYQGRLYCALNKLLQEEEGPGGKALVPLKYMLLCKIMLNLVCTIHCVLSTRSLPYLSNIISFLQPEDVTSLLTLKMSLKYAQLREVECMRAVARAHQNRNLADFEKALKDYKDGQSYHLTSSTYFY